MKQSSKNLKAPGGRRAISSAPVSRPKRVSKAAQVKQLMRDFGLIENPGIRTVILEIVGVFANLNRVAALRLIDKYLPSTESDVHSHMEREAALSLVDEYFPLADRTKLSGEPVKKRQR